MSSELATSYAALILTDDHVEITVKYRSNNTTSSNDRHRWMNEYNNHCNGGPILDSMDTRIDGFFFGYGDLGTAREEGEIMPIGSDKLQTLLKAANVEVESIWTSLFAKALDGKDVAAMLSNVGAAGSAPAAGAAAPAAGAAAVEKAEEKKEEAKEESDDDMGFGLFD
ncbi:hypothetical protein BGX30_009703 [Mortierella sp. GBA39]|nr:hypothetical protein BGX30_009703 [Mortierella sp. GBA39]